MRLTQLCSLYVTHTQYQHWLYSSIQVVLNRSNIPIHIGNATNWWQFVAMWHSTLWGQLVSSLDFAVIFMQLRTIFSTTVSISYADCIYFQSLCLTHLKVYCQMALSDRVKAVHRWGFITVTSHPAAIFSWVLVTHPWWRPKQIDLQTNYFVLPISA